MEASAFPFEHQRQPRPYRVLNLRWVTMFSNPYLYQDLSAANLYTSDTW